MSPALIRSARIVLDPAVELEVLWAYPFRQIYVAIGRRSNMKKGRKPCVSDQRFGYWARQ